MIPNGEDAVLEVDVTPPGVHDLLFPRSRRQEELKDQPLFRFGRAEQKFEIVGMVRFDDSLGELVMVGDARDPIRPQERDHFTRPHGC